MILGMINRFLIQRSAKKMHAHFEQKYREYKHYQAMLDDLDVQLNKLRGDSTKEADLVHILKIRELNQKAFKDFETAFFDDLKQCHNTITVFEKALAS